MIDQTSFVQLEQTVFNIKDDQIEMAHDLKTLTSLVERIIRLEERSEGIARAHSRIDALVRLFWSGAGSVALAIFTVWITRNY